MNNDMFYYDYIPLIGAKLYLKELKEIFRSSSVNIDSLALDELQVSPGRSLFNRVGENSTKEIEKLRDRESAILNLTTLLMEWLGDRPKAEFTLETFQYLLSRLEGYTLPLKKKENVSLADVKTEGDYVTFTNGVVLSGRIPEITISKLGTKETGYESMVASFLLLFKGDVLGNMYLNDGNLEYGPGILKMSPLDTQSSYKPIYLIASMREVALSRDSIYFVIPEDMANEIIEFNNLKGV